MNIDHLVALFHLQAPSDRMSTASLADALGITVVEAESIADDLLGDGLLCFIENSDGADASLAATAAGRARLLDDMQRVNGSLTRVLDTFDNDERSTILAFLAGIATERRP